MSDSNGRHGFAPRGLALVVAAVIAVEIGAFSLVSWLGQVHGRREAVEKLTRCDGTQPNDCSVQSYQANVRAANANEDTADLALFQLILNTVGIGVVGVTIFYAHRAWKEAQSSADAAREANRIARDAFEAGQRAWMELVGITIEPPGLKWTNGEGIVSFTVHAKNSGKTPARGVWTELRLCIELGPPRGVGDQMIKNATEFPDGLGSLIFPDAKLIQPISVGINPADIEAFEAKMLADHGPGVWNSDALFVSLLGVISYKPMPNAPRCYTAFSMNLQNLSPGGQAFHVGQDVGQQSMLLMRSPIGDVVAT